LNFGLSTDFSLQL